MDQDDEEVGGFKMGSDGDDDEPLELEDEPGSFKFDEEPEEDPEDKFH